MAGKLCAVSDDGPVLRADGVVEGKPVLPSSSPPPAAPDAPLELAERSPPVPAEPRVAWFQAPTRSRAWLVAVMVLVGLAIAAVAMKVRPSAPVRLPVLAGPPVVITSEPPGATIEAGGTVLGTTPWAGDNPFILDTQVTLTMPGYRPQTATIPGAREAHLSLQLRRGAR